MPTVILNVNGFDATSDLWSKVGSTPYLDLQDYPTNLIRHSVENQQSKWFSFANLPSWVTGITQVLLKVRCMSESGGHDVYQYWNDGSTNGTLGTYLHTAQNTWETDSTDVTAQFGTIAKINTASVGFAIKTGGGYYFNIDHVYLEVVVTGEPSTLTPPSSKVTVNAVEIAVQNVLEINVHLGATIETGSFEIVVDNGNPDYNNLAYSPGGAKEFTKGNEVIITLKRGTISASTLPTITGVLESLEYQDEAEEYGFRNVVVLRGRCKAKGLFSRKFNGDLIAAAGSAKAEDLVTYLIENYTSLDHTRGASDLIATSNTSFTEFVCEHETVFDIIKYISDVASTVGGVIGYDFGVEYDGIFFWRAKGANNETYSLSGEVQVERYMDDATRIKNKIWVYGKADKPFPLDADGQNYSDLWSESSNTDFGTLKHSATAGDTVIWEEGWGDPVPGDVVFIHEGAGPREIKTVDSFLGGRTDNLTNDANSGQKQVKIASTATYAAGQKVWLHDETPDSEQCVIASVVDGTTLEMVDNLTNTYTVALNAQVIRYGKITLTQQLVNSYNWTGGAQVFQITTAGWVFESFYVALTIAVNNSVPVHTGTKSVKLSHNVSGFTSVPGLVSEDPIDLEVYDEIRLLFYFDTTAPASIEVRVYSGANCDEEAVSNIFTGFSPDAWVDFVVPTGSKNLDKWSTFTGGFSWTDVHLIEFKITWSSGGTYSYVIDRFYSFGKRWGGGSNNSAVDGFAEEVNPSQNTYGIQEHVVINDALLSDAECEAKAQSLLAFYKAPRTTFEATTETLDLGDGTITVGNKVAINFVPLGISDSYRINAADVFLSSSDLKLIYRFYVDSSPLRTADYLYSLSRRVRALERDYKTIR